MDSASEDPCLKRKLADGDGLEHAAALAAVEAVQQMRYSGRPTVQRDPSIETLVLGGHAHEIIPGLYLGSAQAAAAGMGEKLRALNITGIVNCTADHEAPNAHAPFIEYARIALHDNEMAPLAPYLPGASSFIARHHGAGGSVLVHCMRGVSRSASVVIAYLVARRGLSRDDAYELAKRRRPLVSPNLGFWQQLGEFAAEAGAGMDGVVDAAGAAASEAVFDDAWSRQACASFHMGDRASSAGCAVIPTDPGRRGDALLAGLDFVLGRSAMGSDVAWLRALCGACDAASAAAATSTARMGGSDGEGGEGGGRQSSSVAFLESEISSEEFQDRWSCDFRPRALEALLVALGKLPLAAEAITEGEEPDDGDAGAE